jgi:thioredoxin-like negative regulator of GroEL
MSELGAEPPRVEIHGFPLWIKVATLVVAALLIVSLVRVGPVFHDAIQVERSHKHLAAGDFGSAEAELKPVASRYPDSVDFALDLTEAALGAKDYQSAAETLTKLQGREVSDDQGKRADAMAAQLDDVASKLQGAGK